MWKIPVAAALASLLVVSGASAASKTYQVTGPVLEVTDTTVVVQKGDEKWEIKKSPDTKISGQLKPGEKVTVVYTMAASSIESKGTAEPAKKTK